MNSMNSKGSHQGGPGIQGRLPGRGGVDQHQDQIVLMGVVRYALAAGYRVLSSRPAWGTSVKNPTKSQRERAQRVKMPASQAW